ncbi:flagellar motor stator protein MotA [Pantoea dispersa]|uniref:flagellar motor stator protein MotA n=1 Tax=Pantoea dispersa TaxID=59814 RepID=UPI001CA76CD7|nr:flagellar motor stator protein MotA [Pantoea dispersa]QZY97832.1 flagellar motor stator protein MotA [Pantoea dispersa]
MPVLAGYFVVIAAILTGCTLSGGTLSAFIQPAELLIIAGASGGTFLAGNTGPALLAVLRALPETLRGSRYGAALASELLALLFHLLSRARHRGMLVLDAEIMRPHDSPLFQRYPRVLANPLLLACITDCLRLRLMGNLDDRDMDALLAMEADTLEQEREGPAGGIIRLADALPAFGIVAAVLGVIHALGSTDRGAHELGALVAQAMVGTFLGILLSYGCVAPLAARLRQQYAETARMMHCVRLVMVADMRGCAPREAVESGRRALYADVRPSFSALEQTLSAVRQAENFAAVAERKYSGRLRAGVDDGGTV